MDATNTGHGRRAPDPIEPPAWLLNLQSTFGDIAWMKCCSGDPRYAGCRTIQDTYDRYEQLRTGRSWQALAEAVGA